MWPCIITNFFKIRPTKCTKFANLFLAWNSTCFGQCLFPSSRVHSLYTQQWYISYKFVDSFRTGSQWNWFLLCCWWQQSKNQFHPDTNLFDIYHCWVYSEWTPDDGQRHCPKHVEFHSKNKFANLVRLVGLIIKKFIKEFRRGKAYFVLTWDMNKLYVIGDIKTQQTTVYLAKRVFQLIKNTEEPRFLHNHWPCPIWRRSLSLRPVFHAF